MNNIARGGTELMEERINSIDPTLLSNFQIIHSRVRDIDENKKTVLVLHDLAQDPEVQHLKDGGWAKFDKLIFVSNWQQEMYNLYLGVPYSAGFVLPNAIEPIPSHDKPDGVIRLMYFSTPHRGLDILYAAFNQLASEFSNVELSVFSSFDLYGWPENDKPFLKLFDKLQAHPKIEYHKSVSNDVIRAEIQRSHIFAYPSTWQETSCLCLIEAMSGGLISVHSSLAALPETSMGLTAMYGYVEDKNMHAEILYGMLYQMVQTFNDSDARKSLQSRLKYTKAIVDSKYSWESRAQQWTAILKSLL